MPKITKNIGSFSYEHPSDSGSAIAFIVEKTNKNEIIEAFREFQVQKYPILKISNSPLVSMDYVGEEYSAIIDTRWLDIIDTNLIKIVLWYDNEYGYCCNVMNQIRYISSLR